MIWTVIKNDTGIGTSTAKLGEYHPLKSWKYEIKKVIPCSPAAATSSVARCGIPLVVALDKVVYHCSLERQMYTSK